LMLTVFIIIGITLYQERKTEKALSALKELASPRALVLRDGIEIRIPSHELVVGDLVIIREGDRIPADGYLVSCTNLSVDESMLTGESLSITKNASDGIFSGTLAVKGHGRAIIDQTGPDTAMGKIGSALAGIEIERTRLQREVDRIVRIVAVASIATALVVFVVYGLTRANWLEGALAGIASSMALLPEEFPVILTVFLALGAWRMSQERVIARRMPAIETLGSVTALCVDKTGTLTLNQMAIEEISSNGILHKIDLSTGKKIAQPFFEEIATYGLLASPINPFDPMDRAFHAIATRDESWNLIREYPVSDRLLAITHIWQSPNNDEYIVATKGAPEAIAKLCSLDQNARTSMMKDVDEATQRGYRVLGVARARISSHNPLPESPEEIPCEFLGLVHLHDPIRPGVIEAVAQCATAGIRTIMLTGDYPGTALSIAKEIGLHYQGGVITGDELEAMDDEQLAKRVALVSIFARVVPSQKLRLIRALKSNGDVVGMTGDGVNDAPALRAADIGIAMGQRGTDVARESAALIITDDDFTSIASGIRHGRRIYANLRKGMSYVIAVHIPIFGMALIPVFVSDWPLVLLPAQIAFLELIIDPACSIVFESEEPDPQIMKEKPRKLQEKILNKQIFLTSLTQGLVVLASTLTVYLWALSSLRSDEQVRSLAFATLMIGNISLILVNRSRSLTILKTMRTRKNKSVKWILASSVSILVLIFNVPWLQTAFNLENLSASEWIIVICSGIGSVLWFEFYKVIRTRSK
jgi:Ca2+-transporting ATPase